MRGLVFLFKTMELFIKLNNTEETKFLVANYPNAFMLLTLIALRTNRNTGKAQIGVSDFTKNGMTEKSYRTAKSILEKYGYCKFTGTKKGTIAEISDKIYNLNMGEDKGEERAKTTAKTRANTEKTEKEEQTIQYNNFESEKGEDTGEDKNKNGRSDGRLTKNIYNNKEYYSNNINIITSENEPVKLNDLIPLFEDYNMNYEDIFKNKTERKALQDVVDKIQVRKNGCWKCDYGTWHAKGENCCCGMSYKHNETKEDKPKEEGKRLTGIEKWGNVKLPKSIIDKYKNLTN